MLYQRDRDYVVKDGDEGPEVIIVDEFTGRLMPGRRWSDGLHQAVEAKEGVKIQRENQTLATITFQNYFRMYKKLAGMTGTAETEAAEFQKTYNIDVTVIPTNRPMIRKEFPDMVYRTEEEKFRNAAKEIKKFNETGQPVLVGTISVEKSERLSGILKRMGVRHEVLNAKNHEREASIVAQAGRKGAVTVSTNMAGRGTDILLGGNPEFMTKDACLKEKVAERLSEDEAQYVADEHFYYFTHQDQFYRVRRDKWDELYTGFKGRPTRSTTRWWAWAGCTSWPPSATNRAASTTSFADAPAARATPAARGSSSPCRTTCCASSAASACRTSCCGWAWKRTCRSKAKLITKRIAKAQEAVEVQNFEARKHLLEYDDVNNKQRQAVYGMRRQLLEGVDQKERVLDMVRGIVEQFVRWRCPDDKHPDTWDLGTLRNDVLTSSAPKSTSTSSRDLTSDEMADAIFEQAAAEVPGEGRPGGRRHHAPDRAHRHAAGDRQPVEGPPAVDGRVEAGHRQPRLRAEGSAGRVQEGILRAVHRHDGPHRGRNGPLPVLPAGEHRRAPGAAVPRGGRRGRAGRGALRTQRAAAPGRQEPDGGLHAQYPAQEGKGAEGPAVRGRRRLDCRATGERRPEGGPQRSMPLRQRQEIQEVPRAVNSEELIASIGEAFAGVERPPLEELAGADTYMDRSFIDGAGSRTWQELRPLRRFIGDGSEIALFSAKAYQYYLPAYLVALVEEAGEEFYLNGVLDSLWYEVEPYSQQLRDFFNPRKGMVETLRELELQMPELTDEERIKAAETRVGNAQKMEYTKELTGHDFLDSSHRERGLRLLWEERMPLLTREQKQSIARLLEHILERTGDSFDAPRIQTMLDRYWHAFLVFGV